MNDPVELGRSSWDRYLKFKNHPSIMYIKENIVSPEIFKFCKINLDDILKELKGCACYICAGLFFKFKQKHFSN